MCAVKLIYMSHDAHLNRRHVHLWSYGGVKPPFYKRDLYGGASICRLLKIKVSFAEYSLVYETLLRKRLAILRSLLIVATPCESFICAT